METLAKVLIVVAILFIIVGIIFVVVNLKKQSSLFKCKEKLLFLKKFIKLKTA